MVNLRDIRRTNGAASECSRGLGFLLHSMNLIVLASDSKVVSIVHIGKSKPKSDIALTGYKDFDAEL